jgi:hypothetical protein
MAKPSETASDIDLPQLQINLQRHESLRGGLTAISAERDDGRYTKGIHQFTPRVPKRSLRVVEDPDGDATPPSGQALVCRGTAWISDDDKKVALFRVT